MTKVATKLSQLAPIDILWGEARSITSEDAKIACQNKWDIPVATSKALTEAAALLIHYSFELCDRETVSRLIKRLGSTGQSGWVRLAVIEALYQGRYKAISVEQILALWHRLGQPVCHFNLEFERIVCSRMPLDLIEPENSSEQLADLPAETTPAEVYAHQDSSTEPPSESPDSTGDRAATLNLKELAARQRETNNLEPTSNTQPGGSKSNSNSKSEPISQFTPADSDFSAKLKAVVSPAQDL
ncbi:MAG: hypothetical protein GDA56_17020 [Hormoscilla sp. GM7CHS1pb]|nr:hypothetical protein [Hormoscilla sp. GM7CHS1pb]